MARTEGADKRGDWRMSEYPAALYKAEAEFFSDKSEHVDKETGEVTKGCEAVRRLEAHRLQVIQDKHDKRGRR